MDKEQFFSFVKYSVQDILKEHGVDAKVELQAVMKSNDQRLTGLTMRCEGENISPCIYLDDMFERYQDGLEMEYIVNEVVDLMERSRDPEIDLRKFTEYETAKEYLSFRLVDIGENKYWLEDKVWEPMGDFAKVCCLDVEQNSMGYMSVVVTMGNLAMMGETKEQVLADAQKNLNKSEYVFMNLAEVMRDFSPDMLDVNPAAIADTPVFVLTNPKKIQGAVMIARPDIMKEVGEQLGCDYYILPSSKHEVLIVPVNAGIDLDILCWMVQDVNETQVSVEDKLSDRVQYYDREKELIRNALDFSENEIVHEKNPKEKEHER